MPVTIGAKLESDFNDPIGSLQSPSSPIGSSEPN